MDTLLLLIFLLVLLILPFSYFCYGEYKMWKYKKEVEKAEQENEEELSWLKQRLLSFFTSRNLRAVSLYNYYKYNYYKNLGIEFGNIYSVKLDVGNDNGFKFYRFSGNDRCGDIIDEPTKEDYENVLTVINDIVTHEKDIPSNIKRNILVTLSR